MHFSDRQHSLFNILLVYENSGIDSGIDCYYSSSVWYNFHINLLIAIFLSYFLFVASHIKCTNVSLTASAVQFRKLLNAWPRSSFANTFNRSNCSIELLAANASSRWSLQYDSHCSTKLVPCASIGVEVSPHFLQMCCCLLLTIRIKKINA